MDTGNCKSCGASIIWIRTKAGKAIPCNPYEENIVVIEGEKIIGIDAFGETFSGYKHVPENRMHMVYISHFATCPHQAAWRKKS